MSSNLTPEELEGTPKTKGGLTSATCSPRYFAKAWHPIHPEHGPDLPDALEVYEDFDRYSMSEGWEWVECVVIDRETFERISRENVEDRRRLSAAQSLPTPTGSHQIVVDGQFVQLSGNFGDSPKRSIFFNSAAQAEQFSELVYGGISEESLQRLVHLVRSE